MIPSQLCIYQYKSVDLGCFFFIQNFKWAYVYIIY